MQFLLYGVGLLAGAVANVATGMNASLGKGFGDHRMPAALAIQATGVAGLSGLYSASNGRAAGNCGGELSKRTLHW